MTTSAPVPTRTRTPVSVAVGLAVGALVLAPATRRHVAGDDR